jgi:CRP/FNR family transcriptional regulator, cyclic AMP receptor protein
VLLAMRGAGELCGELSVLDGGSRSCTVVAASPCRVFVVLAADFMRFVAENDLQPALLRHAVGRIRESDEIRLELATAPVAVRLASALTRLAAVSQASPRGVPIALSQQELALLVGASRNAVGQALARWRANGWLTTRGGLVLTDLSALSREPAPSSLVRNGQTSRQP